MIKIKTSSILIALLLTFSISACSNDDTPNSKQASASSPSSSDNSSETNTNWVDDSLVISFSAGPNQGRHEYIVGDRSSSSIALSFSENNGDTGVMFLEAADLVSKEGGLQIGSLKRYTKGDLQIGKNSASTWRGETISQGEECDEVSLAVDNGPQSRIKTYGNSTHCNPVEILSMTDWRKVGSIKKERQVSGRFSDTVKFRSNSSQNPDGIVTDMTVEFVITQTAMRY